MSPNMFRMWAWRWFRRDIIYSRPFRIWMDEMWYRGYRAGTNDAKFLKLVK